MSPLNVRYSSYVRNILYVRALISLSNQKSLNYKKMQIMKKIILSSFVICTLLSACNKESLQEQQEIIPNEDLVQIVLSASYPESKADSKAFLNTDGKIYWKQGDEVSILYKEEHGSFGASETGLTADFYGSISKELADKIWNGGSLGDEYLYGVYPYKPSNSLTEQRIRTPFGSQEAIANGFDPMNFISAGRSHTKDIAFYNVLSGIKLKTKESYSTIYLTGNNNEVLRGVLLIKFGQDGKPFVENIESNISGDYWGNGVGISGNIEPDTYYYLLFPPTHFEKGFTLEFAKQLPSNEYKVAGRRVYSKDVNFPRNKFGVLNNADEGNMYIEFAEFPEPETIDLGLSVQWATTNIQGTGWVNGQTYRYHFSWGELHPKLYYDTEHYKFADETGAMTKYNSSDNLSRLTAEDDIAVQLFGDKFRMPTKKEFQELYEGCTWEWTEKDGVEGMLGTSKENGKTIFFPADGYYASTASTDEGTNEHSVYFNNFVELWTSDLYTENSGLNNAYAVSYRFPKIGDAQWGGKDRSDGLSVRAVYATDATTDAVVAVDLGLSVKWANCNIGANTPQEAGYYYAWGEFPNKNKYQSHGWDDYAWCDGIPTGTQKGTLTKYCTNPEYGSNGYSDKLTVLEKHDDAAHMYWRGKWRIPTMDEWKELVEECTWTPVIDQSYDMLKYYEVKGPSGNSIILPVNDYSTDGETQYGYYWANSINTVYPDQAQGVQFKYGNGSSGTYSLWSMTRYEPYGIRAVKENE